jgi:hypothetical protein
VLGMESWAPHVLGRCCMTKYICRPLNDLSNSKIASVVQFKFLISYKVAWCVFSIMIFTFHYVRWINLPSNCRFGLRIGDNYRKLKNPIIRGVQHIAQHEVRSALGYHLYPEVTWWSVSTATNTCAKNTAPATLTPQHYISDKDVNFQHICSVCVHMCVFWD